MKVIRLDHVQLAMPAGGEDARALARDIAAAGYDVVDDEPLDGYDRVYVHDPFGNRIELMQPLA